MGECIHGLTDKTCSICMEPQKNKAALWETYDGGNEQGILAKYPGHCGECHNDIEVGDPLVHVDDRWIHEDCK